MKHFSAAALAVRVSPQSVSMRHGVAPRAGQSHRDAVCRRSMADSERFFTPNLSVAANARTLVAYSTQWFPLGLHLVLILTATFISVLVLVDL